MRASERLSPTDLDIHEVKADYILIEKGTSDSLLQTVEEQKVDLVLIGGYGGSMIRDIVVGSYLDFVLRNSTVPTFICR